MLPALASIQDLSEFLNFLNKTKNISFAGLGGSWVFRGQTDSLWNVLPKVGRLEYLAIDDLKLFYQWRSQAIAYSSTLPENDLECLAIAQHYGLATRLLDWSTNPLVALYFACESHNTLDGAVYCFSPTCHLSSDINLDEITDVARFTPRPFDPRILAQSSCFTYHPDPRISLEFPNSNKIVNTERLEHQLNYVGIHFAIVTVPAKSKDTILFQLSVVGIDRRSLFPNLEGLSYSLNWQSRNPSIQAEKKIIDMNTIKKTTNRP
jgi:hypothetical protein